MRWKTRKEKKEKNEEWTRRGGNGSYDGEGGGINVKRRLCSRGGGRVNQVSLSGPRDWGRR